MPSKEIDHLIKMAQELVDQELPRSFQKEGREQKTILNALKRDPTKIFELPNVVGIGVGYQQRRRTMTREVGPLVFVSKKVRANRLKPKERIPKSITVRRKRLRVDVIKLGKIEPLCMLSIPDTQHLAHDPIPPDVAFAGWDPATGQRVTQGSGGAIVRQPGGSPRATFLLSCRHVLADPAIGALNISQPWTNRIVGGHVASSAVFDAAVAEVQSPERPYNLASPPFHCFGPVVRTIDPIIGMNVKKSGARTGLTGSFITGLMALSPAAVGRPDVIMDYRAWTPPQIPPGLVNQPYVGSGDSGSMSLLGNPVNPWDFGQPVQNAMNTLLSAVPPQFRTLVQFLVSILLMNSAVALNHSITTFGGRVVAMGHQARLVLTDLGVTLA